MMNGVEDRKLIRIKIEKLILMDEIDWKYRCNRLLYRSIQWIKKEVIGLGGTKRQDEQEFQLLN